jgi:uncharacterized protein (TIGR02145 family)
MVTSKQIGWSPEANLYYQISQQLERLIGVTSKVVLGPPPIPPIPTVTIGTQEWMLENLNVDRYANGDVIEEVQDQTAWAALTTGAWCYYQNNTANGVIYGKLYNWYAVNDPRGLAPTGFHIPSDAEWTTLTTTLGGSAVAGGELKEVGLTHWNSPNTGATNSSGWTGLPGGIRNNLLFTTINRSGVWWSSTEFDSLNAFRFAINYQNTIAGQGTNLKVSGYSVRAIKN